MSSTDPSPSPSPSLDPSSSSVSSNDQHGTPGASSNLYLVTFLATLFLLLFVSFAIVLRSYMLRRRYQRRLDEAMAAGMLLAPRTQGSKRKRLGAKPALFDTCLADGGVTWQHIKPLSAQPIFVKRKYKDGRVPKDGVIISGPTLPGGVDPHLDPSSPTNPSSNSNPPATASRSRPRLLPVSFPWPWRSPSADRNRSPTTNEPELHDDMEVALIEQECPASPGGLAASPQMNGPLSPTTGIGTTAATYKVRVEMLQVSVLIAMPSQSRTVKKNKNLYHPSRAAEDDDDDDDDDEDEDEDEVLPELVFGVTRVNYRQPKVPERKQELFVPPSPSPSPLPSLSPSSPPQPTSVAVPS